MTRWAVPSAAQDALFEGRRAIYRHLVELGSADAAQPLPDEDPDAKGLRWVAGGLDGAFGHHASPGQGTDQAKLLYRLLGVVLADPTVEKLGKLYQQLHEASALEYVDPLLEELTSRGDLDRDDLAR